MLLVVLSLALDPPKVIVRRPNPLQKNIHVLCNFTLANTAISMVFNGLVLGSCGVLAFLCRKMPDNYSETIHIFFSIVMTVFAYAGFMPAFLLSQQVGPYVACRCS